MKPILFNTEMVCAILNGRKTATRRIIKPQPLDKPLVFHDPEEGMNIVCHVEGMKVLLNYFPPYQSGDVLWVRETWCCNNFGWHYRADWPAGNCPDMSADDKWHPSIHMPREAARIFLRVKQVRAEQLQEIDNAGALLEGCDGRCSSPADGALNDVEKFRSSWDRTVKPADRAIYGWDANPWVWVIEFERLSE
ncbi:MAG: hypothetical protein KIC46_04915 [Clostridiales bacterium]|nr:hypothetical protein [Clostridiales bacterium]